jgi:hypothetical protein
VATTATAVNTITRAQRLDRFWITGDTPFAIA